MIGGWIGVGSIGVGAISRLGKRDTETKAAKLFNSLDKDKNQVIDYNEALLFVPYNLSSSNLTDWFDQIDKNKNGVIEPSEFDRDLELKN